MATWCESCSRFVSGQRVLAELVWAIAFHICSSFGTARLGPCLLREARSEPSIPNSTSHANTAPGWGKVGPRASETSIISQAAQKLKRTSQNPAPKFSEVWTQLLRTLHQSSQKFGECAPMLVKCKFWPQAKLLRTLHQSSQKFGRNF